MCVCDNITSCESLITLFMLNWIEQEEERYSIIFHLDNWIKLYIFYVKKEGQTTIVILQLAETRRAMPVRLCMRGAASHDLVGGGQKMCMTRSRSHFSLTYW